MTGLITQVVLFANCLCFSLEPQVFLLASYKQQSVLNKLSPSLATSSAKLFLPSYLCQCPPARLPPLRDLRQVSAMPLRVQSSRFFAKKKQKKKRETLLLTSRCLEERLRECVGACDLTAGPFTPHCNVLPACSKVRDLTHTHTHTVTSQRGLPTPVSFSARPEAAPDVTDRSACWLEHYSC